MTPFPTPAGAAHSAPQHSREALRSLQSQSRYLFREDEFAARTGRKPGSAASQMALQRMAKAGLIVLAQKRPAKWLVIPPEQDHYGAPPVEWWLDDLMHDQEPAYYLALLSAARFWGSAHYAYQAAQVMVRRPHGPITVGKIRVEFIVKKELDATPVVQERTRTAHVRVSTREATVLDLIRHQTAIGGLEALARIARDLAPKMTVTGVQDAVKALNQVPAAQRLGFILDRLGHHQLASAVSRSLRLRRRGMTPLETPLAGLATDRMRDSTWAIEYTPQQGQILKEARE